METYYKGDSIELEYVLYKNKAIREYWNLNGWTIKAQLTENGTNIKKSTTGIESGNDTEILITNSTKGTFIIKFTPEESNSLEVGIYKIGIQIINDIDNKKITVIEDSIEIKPALFDW